MIAGKTVPVSVAVGVAAPDVVGEIVAPDGLEGMTVAQVREHCRAQLSGLFFAVARELAKPEPPAPLRVASERSD